MSSNIVFWLVAVALLVATIAAVTLPLLRGRRDSGASPADPELDSMRNELAQLEARRAWGEVSQDEYTQQKQALAVRLLDQIAAPGATMTAAMTATAAMTEASPATATASAGKPALAQKDAAAVTPKTGRNRWLAPAAAAFVIVLCAVFYAVLGLPGTARHPSVTAGEEAQGNTDGAGKSGNVSLSQEQIQRMV